MIQLIEKGKQEKKKKISITQIKYQIREKNQKSNETKKWIS